MKKIYPILLAFFLLNIPSVWAQKFNGGDSWLTYKQIKDETIAPKAATAIQSKFIQLNNGGGDMMLLGDPEGKGIFSSNGYRYNYNISNRYVICTGLAVPDLLHIGQYLKPEMIMTNPSGNPNATAFTLNNVTNQTITYFASLSAEKIVYHDKIDGFTGLPNPDGVNDGFTGSYTIAGFSIEHTAQIVLNTYTGVPDVVEFFFTVKNTSSQASVFGLSWNVDTYIGTNGGDAAPFNVAGLRQFTTSEVSMGFPILVGSVAEAYYDSKSLFQIGYNPYTTTLPEYFYPLHPTFDYSAVIRTNLGYKNGILWQKADYVAIASYSSISTNFFFGVNNGQHTGSQDSEHMLRWDPQLVKPGEILHIAYSYGAGSAENTQAGVINFMDQMAPAIIETDIDKTFYTNAPFTSTTTIVNETFAHILSGTITLKIPHDYLEVEDDMLVGGGWVASGSDLNYNYYKYTVGALNPSATHEVHPPVHLDVIPQCASDINTSYWLILEVEAGIRSDV
jgi:hypothetical protein